MTGAVAVLATLCLFQHADAVGIATASIDLGNEWIKIGLVKPGVPMDIVLNQESKRKTSVVIGLRDGERTFSSPAEVVQVKYPKEAFAYMTELLGLQVSSKTVQDWIAKNPHHQVEADPIRGTVVFRLGENTTYTVEELVAQVVDHAVQNAASFAEQEISSIVLTCPPYFNQAQRKALLEVGKIANLKILQLLNTNMAVAVNYGVFRQSSFNETAQNILFYDMGSTSTTATIVSYSTIKEKGQTKPTAQAEIKAVGVDRTLGGMQWDFRIRDHLMNVFMTDEKTAKKLKGEDPSKNPRAMAKLFKNAQKVKTVLSANKETKAQVEGLFNEIDFKTMISREQVEDMTKDLFDRVAGPINDALADAKMTTADIDQIILFGGGVRVPKVQTILKEVMGVETLGKSINGDEAACLGASYQAAVLSKGYRVKKFIIRDINAYPVQVNFDREQVDNVTNATFTKRLKNTIFPRGNPFPQRKVLTFKNFKEDFGFDLNYGNLSRVPASDMLSFGSENISTYNLTEVKAAFEGHDDDEEKGVKVHFRIDESGMVSIDKAEAVFEREPVPEPEPKSLLEKASSWFGFGGDDNATNATEAAANATNATEGTEADEAAAEGDEKATEETPTPDDDKPAGGDDAGEKSEEKTEETPTPDDDKPTGGDDADEKSEENTEETPKPDEDGANATDADANATDVNGTAVPKANATIETNTTLKKIVIKEPLVATSTPSDIPDFDGEAFVAAQARIQALVDKETERKNREAALNTLEGMIYKNKDFLYNEETEAVTNETQREDMNANLTAIGEWLDEDGWEANFTTLNNYIRQVNQTMKSAYYRVGEATTRPAALEKLHQSLNSSNTLAAYLKLNISDRLEANETLWHTTKEVDDLANLVNETEFWLAGKLGAQANVSAWEAPAVTTRHITEKTNKLDREYYYLVKKPKPKPKKKPKKAGLNLTDTDGIKIVVNDTEADADTNGTTANDTDAEAGVDADADAGADAGAAEDGAEETAEAAPDTASGDDDAAEKPAAAADDSAEADAKAAADKILEAAIEEATEKAPPADEETPKKKKKGSKKHTREEQSRKKKGKKDKKKDEGDL